MKNIRTFEEWLYESKNYGQTISHDEFAKIEVGSTVLYAGARYNVKNNTSYTLDLESNKSTLSVNFSMFNKKGAILKENQIFETQFGSTKVAIFPGRFQPFHLGHLAAFKEASRRFGVPVVPIQIFSKTDKSPIPDKVLEKMGNDMVKEFDFLAGYVLYPSTLKTVVPQMVKLLREQYGFEAIGMGCGSDRLKSYEPQIKYLNSEKSDVPVSQTFQLEMVDERIPDGPSGTKVREAIANGDQESFEKYMPKSLHKYFGELQKYIK
jgi:cytidyltransferase-like protein